VIATRIDRYGLRLKPGVDVEIVQPARRPALQGHLERVTTGSPKRKGVTRALAQDPGAHAHDADRRDAGADGEADAMLCGTVGTYADHLKYVRTVIGSRPGVSTLAAMQLLILPERQLFICDTHVNLDPTAEQIAEMTMLAAEEVRRFGIEPAVALLSHSNFGSSDAASAQKMRDALESSVRTRPTSRSTARCRATWRCRTRCWRRCSPIRT